MKLSPWRICPTPRAGPTPSFTSRISVVFSFRNMRWYLRGFNGACHIAIPSHPPQILSIVSSLRGRQRAWRPRRGWSPARSPGPWAVEAPGRAGSTIDLHQRLQNSLAFSTETLWTGIHQIAPETTRSFNTTSLMPPPLSCHVWMGRIVLTALSARDTRHGY